MTVVELVGHFMSSPEFREKLHRALQYAEGAPQAVDLDGFTLYVRDDAAVGGQILRDRAYEPAVTAAIETALRPGSVFVDVGASLGYFTVLGGRAVGPAGKVHAFEPGSQNHSMVLLNAAMNGLENVELHRVAVSDVPGTMLYAGHGANGFVRPFDGDPAAVTTHEVVEATTLDLALGDEARVDVVKIDVEGAEGRVLRGAERVIRRHRPTIVFELSPPGLESVSGMTGVELLSWLEDLGYELTALDTDQESVTAGASAILEAYDAGGLHHLDVLARPV